MVSMVHSIGRCCSVCGAQQGGVVVSMVHSREVL